MLIRLTEVDVYDEEEINIRESCVGDPWGWNPLSLVARVDFVSFALQRNSQISDHAHCRGLVGCSCLSLVCHHLAQYQNSAWEAFMGMELLH